MNIKTRKYATLVTWCLRKLIMNGVWKPRFISEDDIIEKEFDLFCATAIVYLSDIEDIELDGKWKIEE